MIRSVGRCSPPPAGRADSGSGGDLGAPPGQVLVLFALFLSAMLGVLGLSVDLGFAYARHRGVQNAADLGAVAGARAIARYRDDNKISALLDIQQVVLANGLGRDTPVLESCFYIDQGGSEVGDCSLTVPANATGVVVTVTETHDTFFMRALPGAPAQVSSRVHAESQLERYDHAGTDSPFILCGRGVKPLDGGPKMEIVNTDESGLSGGYQVNPDAVGKKFRLSTTKYAGIADVARCTAKKHIDIVNDCNRSETTFGARNRCVARAENSGWAGLAELNVGRGIVLPGDTTDAWWYDRTGLADTNIRPLDNEVHGAQGCPKNGNLSFGCVMMIPIATLWDPATRAFRITKVMAFLVTKKGPNEYWGTLLDDYLVYGSSVPIGIDQAAWGRDSGSVLVPRLAQ